MVSRPNPSEVADPSGYPTPEGWTLIQTHALEEIVRMIPREQLPGAERILARMKKVKRGFECKQVIREVKELRAVLLARRANPPTFECLKAEFPRRFVLKVLSDAKRFNNEDRQLVCKPHQWGRAATYAYGILKKLYDVNSNATIRDYIKAANRDARKLKHS
jgi:hypothetical protein